MQELGMTTPSDVNEILQLHAECVAEWHRASIENPYDGFLRLVCEQHAFNFRLWHQEDIARSRDASDEEIAAVKRTIDRLNQGRNDWIEKLDEAIAERCARLGVTPREGARRNTETPGSAIDRLSIMALRIYHYEARLADPELDATVATRVSERLPLCRRQRADLATSLRELLDDIFSGAKLHRPYRQLKMYNDPTLNPYLSGRSQAGGS